MQTVAVGHGRGSRELEIRVSVSTEWEQGS